MFRTDREGPEMQKRRIGVTFGCFIPLHKGHMSIIHQAGVENNAVILKRNRHPHHTLIILWYIRNLIDIDRRVVIVMRVFAGVV